MKNELAARKCRTEGEAGIGMGISQEINVGGLGPSEGRSWLQASVLPVSHQYIRSEDAA